MEDLVQFAIFVGFILIWLLGTGKKKKTQRPQQRPQQKSPQVRAQPRPTAAAGAPTTRSRVPTQRPPPTAQRQPETLADLLRDVLKGELPDVTRVPEPEPEPYEFGAPEAEVFTEEAASLETLEATGEASHKTFHERYPDVPVADPSARRARHLYRLTPKTARDAMIWTAIFSQPKGME
ncbi:MAG: hypothetical protein OEO20_12785 [Gemmatimonadota bacterium]|nr:hypothetical protein [Gemmatimonadota bacterium]MDH3367836.1 hypothetical protein [Gemmatimonadota bacterium]MDH3479171.1 hypothetical protein [Gemmatimonadota bacterium]MDH3569677.1 hypothetical protein [Gemmatimonadota bacterium]MDH5550720.1 hypothetical protein [Gemmatimonadota bacterium]